MEKARTASHALAESWATRPTMAVWSYDSPMGASAGYVRLRELQRRGAVSVADVVTVTWVPGTHRPRIGHLRAPRTVHRPFTYSALGALADVLARSTSSGPGRDPVAVLAELLEGTGLDADVLSTIRSSIAPGRSVMLVLSTGADPAKTLPVIRRGLDRGDVTLAHVVLALDAETTLRSAIETVLLDSRQPRTDAAS